MKIKLLLATIAGQLIAVVPAFADGATEAQNLFDEARQLVGQSRWADACPKLARSNHLEPRATTLFHLAECYEHTAKPASAWNAYLGSAAAAAGTGETRRAQFATERAKQLETSLPYLMVTVNQQRAVVYKDGERIEESRWGSKIPIDPGEHTVVADAPGKQRFSSTVFVVDAATTVVTIPPLLDVAREGPTSPPTGATSRGATSQGRDAVRATPSAPNATSTNNAGLRRWSIILASAGLASAGTGAALSLTAPSSDDGCKGACAAGTGLMIGGALLGAAGLAFFLASFGDTSSGRGVSTLGPHVLSF